MTDFSRTLALLRTERHISQRTAAAALEVSQALLSHYENGIREPGLAFVIRACNYYNVSADFLLGRSMSRDGTTILTPEELPDESLPGDKQVKGSVLALLHKKLIVNSVSMIFDILGKMGRKEAISAAGAYLGTGCYKLFRHIYCASGKNPAEIFNLSEREFAFGLADADMCMAEVELSEVLAAHVKDKGEVPALDDESLKQQYPAQYQSFLQILHSTGARIRRNQNV